MIKLQMIKSRVKKEKKKVFVGMSGGVDSSVSAALLKEQGFDVTGIFIKVWSPDFLPCNWQEERRDAMRVCAALQIPFLTFNFEKEYKKEVVDYMVREYKAGRTPNPDVMCNKYIKFGSFFKKAMDMGADFIATGHYARINADFMPTKRGLVADKLGKTISSLNHKHYTLYAGSDLNKDQSYFLWTLAQKQLAKTFFPVGHLEKSEVRKLAVKFGLPTAAKKDSQGLCFMGKIDLKDFLKHFIKEKSGDVLNERGSVIGKHDGAFFLTIGQRHGFTITEKKPDEKPYYIIAKDISKNTITVSNKENKKSLYASQTSTNYNKPLCHSRAGGNPVFGSSIKEVTLENANWIEGNLPDIKKEYLCRYRYRQTPEICQILQLGRPTSKLKKIRIVFKKPQEFVAAGQSLVVYDGDKCLGGGVINL